MLELLCEKRKAIVGVRDTGQGIRREALAHVFDRYYQAGGPRQASGTGIGLALVKSLAELHEAQLSVVSEEGKGSTFSFAISLDKTYPDAHHELGGNVEALPSENVQTGMADGNETENKVILVVEDNEEVRQYIVEALSRDYRTEVARQGKEGLDVAMKLSPDLIVSDVMMPEMDGVEMTRLLKTDIRTSHIPVILLTAKTSMDDQEKGYDSGADSYLTKPFSSRLLRSRVKNILEGRREMAAFVLEHAAHHDAITPKENAGHAETVDNDVPALSPLDREFLEKLDELIEKNLGVADMDMSFFTDRMAMSHSTFYRKVKSLTGVGANEYVRKVKLKRALAYLKSGRYNVNEVASLTGFNSSGYFRKCFRKEFGVVPSEVMKESGMRQ